jgi:micrococcal nuclease
MTNYHVWVSLIKGLIMYEYKCRILKVIDGDTVDAEVDLGFRVKMQMRFRLAGIDAPEMDTPAGKIARQQLIAWMSDSFGSLVLNELRVKTEKEVRTEKEKQEKYGRYLGTFFDATGASINQKMIDGNYAKEWKQ